MSQIELLRQLAQPASTKIVLLVLDGLGGLPGREGGPTELEAAETPNMDRLAAAGSLGLSIPIRRGITPGSGPAHLSLFGYDPLVFEIGRGVLEAAGVGIEVNKGDVAARANFTTVDDQGRISDRRAGRIPTELARPLVERLAGIQLDGVETVVKAIREYRFAVVMKGSGLSAALNDTDPQSVGKAPLPVEPQEPAAERSAQLFNQWIARAHEQLAGEQRANGVLLRGFSSDPQFPHLLDLYRLKACCIAVYPMYRGVARLVGMQIQQFEGEAPADQFRALANAWQQFDFFFVHIKKPDSQGEDGDFEGKAAVIAEVDAALPILLSLKPDVLAITGDHSTPSTMRSHSWHPVPFLLYAPGMTRQHGASKFGERACALGELGSFQATEIMPMLLACGGRLLKYGA